MSQVQIMAAYENYERILSAYSGDLKKFVGEMETLLGESETLVASLKQFWTGDSYDGFAKISQTEFREIGGSLEVVRELSGIIDKKVPEIRRYIQQLKGEI